MLKKLLVLSALTLAVAVAPAAAMNWSIGANLGAQFASPTDDNIDNASAIGWPQGGLRVGFVGENPVHEVYLDTELDIFSQGDFSANDFGVMANYQYNFGSQGSTAPYVTGGVGVGFSSIDFGTPGSDVSASAVVFGGGVGLRHKMGNGHGTLRGEVRYDRQGKGEDGNVVVIEEAGIIGIKLGFDLWDK
jgi:hypothetical protein